MEPLEASSDHPVTSGVTPAIPSVTPAAVSKALAANPSLFEEATTAGLAVSTNRFGFDLMTQLRAATPGENVFLSPTSIATALWMTWDGARGQTADQMAAVLGVTGWTREQVLRANQALAAQLRSDDPKLSLTVANSLWGRQGLVFQPEFIQRLDSAYGARLTALNFADPSSPGRINAWVQKQTKGKIPKIVDRIPADAALYLINAVWFKGAWAQPFNPEMTVDKPFHRPGIADRSVPMMHRGGKMSYLEGDGFQVVALPYNKGRMRMIVVLPAPRVPLSDFLARLNSATLSQWISQLHSQQGTLGLPKFKIEYQASLSKVLPSMGMVLPFSSGADFSGMVKPPASVAISDVVHKTFLDVNESGTEAAAVTSVAMALTAARPQTPFQMIVDRPFFVAIEDRPTGALVFMGAIFDPK